MADANAALARFVSSSAGTGLTAARQSAMAEFTREGFRAAAITPRMMLASGSGRTLQAPPPSPRCGSTGPTQCWPSRSTSRGPGRAVRDAPARPSRTGSGGPGDSRGCTEPRKSAGDRTSGSDRDRDQPASRAARTEATNAAGAGGALAVEQAAHEGRRRRPRRRPPRHTSTACSGVETPDADQHRLVGDRLEPPGDHQRRWRPASSRSPVTPSRPTAYTKPAGPLADPRQPLVGRGRRGEQHGLDAGRVGGRGPRPDLLEREVGQDGGRPRPAAASDAAKRS